VRKYLKMCIYKYRCTVNVTYFTLYWGGSYQRCGRGHAGDQIFRERSEKESQHHVKFSCCRMVTQGEHLMLALIDSPGKTTDTIDDGYLNELAPLECFLWKQSWPVHRTCCLDCFVPCDPGNDHVNDRLPPRRLYNTLSSHCAILKCHSVVHVLFLHGILAAARLYRPAIFGICTAFNSPREKKANTKLLQILTGCDCEIRRLTHSASESRLGSVVNADSRCVTNDDGHVPCM
jgi:hypothetical protein